jgi:large subunit ribosomal protein L18Ae
MSRVAAVDALYQDMAARHRSRFRQVQVRRSVIYAF